MDSLQLNFGVFFVLNNLSPEDELLYRTDLLLSEIQCLGSSTNFPFHHLANAALLPAAQCFTCLRSLLLFQTIHPWSSTSCSCLQDNGITLFQCKAFTLFTTSFKDNHLNRNFNRHACLYHCFSFSVIFCHPIF